MPVMRTPLCMCPIYSGLVCRGVDSHLPFVLLNFFYARKRKFGGDPRKVMVNPTLVERWEPGEEDLSVSLFSVPLAGI